MLKYIMHLKFLIILSGNSLFPKNILDKNQPFILPHYPYMYLIYQPQHTISYLKYVTKALFCNDVVMDTKNI